MREPQRYRHEMTLGAFAAAVGVNKRTAMAWANKGRIRARLTSRGWIVDAREVERRKLSPREFAQAVGVCERTALRWAESGTISATQPVPGGTWAIDWAEVERMKQPVENAAGRRSRVRLRGKAAGGASSRRANP